MRCCASWATACRRCGDARSSCSIVRVPGRRRSPHRCAGRARRLHALHARLIGLRDAVGLQANLPLEVPRDFVPGGFVALQPFLLTVVSSLGGTLGSR